MSRVQARSQDIVFHEWMGGRKMTADNIFVLYQDHGEWQATSAGRLAAVRTCHDVAGRLPKQITCEMLLAPVTKLYEQFHENAPNIA